MKPSVNKPIFVDSTTTFWMVHSLISLCLRLQSGHKDTGFTWFHPVLLGFSSHLVSGLQCIYKPTFGICFGNKQIALACSKLRLRLPYNPVNTFHESTPLASSQAVRKRPSKMRPRAWTNVQLASTPLARTDGPDGLTVLSVQSWGQPRLAGWF